MTTGQRSLAGQSAFPTLDSRIGEHRFLTDSSCRLVIGTRDSKGGRGATKVTGKEKGQKGIADRQRPEESKT